jgi:aspartate 1-decarboxylase
MLKSKIHRARITGADVHYEGSVTLDHALMDAADILPYETVSIWDVTNGARFETYAIPGIADSGVVCVNGAAARLVEQDDLVIVASFAEMDDAEARAHEPTNVFVDEHNRIVDIRREVAGQSDLRVV